jgi:hypothetical protein
MIYAMNGMQVLDNLQAVTSPGSGTQHWGSSYFGPRYSTAEAGRSPQALLTEMSANETILPHFHGVVQFQIFPAGSGTMGRNEIQPLMLQYKDRHTAYGPLVAGPNGCTFIALRNRTGDSAPVYLSKPGYKEKLKPSKRRNWISRHIPLSTRPIMKYRKDACWEPVYDAEKQITDELDAKVVRLGAGMSVQGPDPKLGNGYYVFVANGSLVREGSDLPLWSVVYVDPSEEGFLIVAGQSGLEAMVMQFPKDDAC